MSHTVKSRVISHARAANAENTGHQSFPGLQRSVPGGHPTLRVRLRGRNLIGSEWNLTMFPKNLVTCTTVYVLNTFLYRKTNKDVTLFWVRFSVRMWL